MPDAASWSPPGDDRLPGWLVPMRDRAGSLRSEDISRFVPPQEPRPRQGAVLVLFGDGPAGPDLLLTERAHTLRSQPAQVSFPGGSVDPGETAVQTALREAEEETGLDAADVEVFGVLPPVWLPPRNFAVTPVLGYWRAGDELAVVNPDEVHAVFRVPVAQLLEPANRFTVVHPMGWRGPAWLIGPDGDVLLWGFTAGIVDALFDHVGWTRPWDRSVVRPLPDRLDERRPRDRPGADPRADPPHRYRDHGPPLGNDR